MRKLDVNEEVKVGKLSYTVKGVQETTKLSSILGYKTTDGKFVIVDLSIKNYDKRLEWLIQICLRSKLLTVHSIVLTLL